jgi:hypothetical protein
MATGLSGCPRYFDEGPEEILINIPGAMVRYGFF